MAHFKCLVCGELVVRGVKPEECPSCGSNTLRKLSLKGRKEMLFLCLDQAFQLLEACRSLKEKLPVRYFMFNGLSPMELEKKHMAIASRVLGISARCYRPISGGGDTMRTIIYEAEFDSLAAFEAHPEKMGADPEMQALVPKFEAVIDSWEVEFYTLMQ